MKPLLGEPAPLPGALSVCTRLRVALKTLPASGLDGSKTRHLHGSQPLHSNQVPHGSLTASSSEFFGAGDLLPL